jgi:hypothetical protein
METIKTLTIKQVKRLKIAFPNNDDDFYSLLIERMLEAGFTGEETVSIVEKAIDGIRPGRDGKITIAEVIHEHKKEKQSHIYG